VTWSSQEGVIYHIQVTGPNASSVGVYSLQVNVGSDSLTYSAGAFRANESVQPHEHRTPSKSHRGL
jgi:hypothetical protein